MSENLKNFEKKEKVKTQPCAQPTDISKTGQVLQTTQSSIAGAPVALKTWCGQDLPILCNTIKIGLSFSSQRKIGKPKLKMLMLAT